jgi:6-phosphogluconolactonase
MDVPVDRSAAELRRGIESLPRTDRGLPRIDLLWLGVGEDGHTLSLFPGHDDALTASDVAIAVHDSPKPPPERITLTLTALAGVGNAVIFATGAAKKEALARALDERQLPIALAAERIVDVGGNVAWLFDPEAASRG